MISIIIPTFNEVDFIGPLIRHLRDSGGEHVADIIVVDAGSTDDTVAVARELNAQVVMSPQKGRAVQMNLGADMAKGDVLYFVHADSLPPSSFVTDIVEEVSQGYEIGCFRFCFRSKKVMLKFNAYCTRFDRIMCRGGDQTLFITQQLFRNLGGYQNDFVIMEDYDLIIRARKVAKFKIIPKDVSVSARKYDDNGYLRVNLANFTIFMLYFMGFSQQTLVRTYKRMIHHPKL